MPPNFNGLRNNIARKVNSIKELVPDISSTLEGEVSKFTNELASFDFTKSAINVLGINDGTAVSSLLSKLNGPGATADSFNFKSNLSAKPGPIGTTNKPGELVPGQSPGPWANELEGFASMNCLMTLSALTKDEVNDPDGTYRKSGVAENRIICRSGGSGTKKVKTAYEKVLGKTLEFFLDDLEFKSIMVADNDARNSNVTTLAFEVTEPYSMGLFLNTLKAAATLGGYANYIEATYMLTLEFVGTDEEGNMGVAPYSRRFLPIKLKTVRLKVSGSGSVYACTAYLSNEQAMQDAVQQVKTDIAVTGATVRELLQSGGQSLTTILNTRLLDMQDKGQVNVADQYVIVFPEDRTSATGRPSAASSNSSSGATINPYGSMADGEFGGMASSSNQLTRAELTEQYRSITGDNEGEVPLNYDQYINSISGIVRSSTEFGSAFKDYANSDFATNIIGQAAIINNPVEAGQSPMGSMQYSQENIDRYPIFSRGSAELQTSGTNRMFKFRAGARIQDIIEEVLLVSSYGQALAGQLSDITNPTGMVQWYRIEADTYTVPENTEVLRTGTSPNIYVYRVVPYMVHSSVFSNPATPAVGIGALKAEAAKEYEYIYTGRNKDILDFEIDYRFAFQAGALADSASSSAQQRQGSAVQSTPNPHSSSYTAGGESAAEFVPVEGMVSQVEVINAGAIAGGGSEISNAEISIARNFNDRLVNSKNDLLMAELTIIGDPFYLSDNGAGNYHAGDTSYTNMTEDGTANYSNGQVHINILFRTPVDIDEDVGNYTFPEDLLLVESFSGLYMVKTVMSTISKNQFTQTLSLNRVLNQQESSTTANTGIMVSTTDARESLNERALDVQRIASAAISELNFPSNIIAYQDELAQLLPKVQELGTIAEQAKAALNTDELAIFGKVGELAESLEASMGNFDIGQVGLDFENIEQTLGQFTGINLDTIKTSTLPSLGTIGASVLPSIPLPGVGSLNAAASFAQSRGASELNALNSNLRDNIGGATSALTGPLRTIELPAVNLPNVDLGGQRVFNTLTNRWESF
tara:strand:+ start:2278 stop:5397 length:3120 start_codon:yes stop_codon:yes gene_type:complete